VLVIRLQRTGRKNQAAYRIVVAEKSAPVKGKHLEVVGTYNPSENKKFTVDQARIDHWISVGAQPSETVAGLLKYNGVSGMEKYMTPRTKNRPKKNPTEAELAAMEEAKNPTPAEEPAPVEEAPAEEAAPVEETPAAEEAAE